ncbi:hypothetical protein [Candidatus Caldatribacterium sp.]|uniref:hypothetical protein n=1 Tax=Candidatus Caldatribacterium sp. TaxID=2282143 RepID=UPI00383C17B5|nr:hypothetical protein [Candidatus Caldatribacterium sp.]
MAFPLDDLGYLHKTLKDTEQVIRQLNTALNSLLEEIRSGRIIPNIPRPQVTREGTPVAAGLTQTYEQYLQTIRQYQVRFGLGKTRTSLFLGFPIEALGEMSSYVRERIGELALGFMQLQPEYRAFVTQVRDLRTLFTEFAQEIEDAAQRFGTTSPFYRYFLPVSEVIRTQYRPPEVRRYYTIPNLATSVASEIVAPILDLIQGPGFRAPRIENENLATALGIYGATRISGTTNLEETILKTMIGVYRTYHDLIRVNAQLQSSLLTEEEREKLLRKRESLIRHLSFYGFEIRGNLEEGLRAWITDTAKLFEQLWEIGSLLQGVRGETVERTEETYLAAIRTLLLENLFRPREEALQNIRTTIEQAVPPENEEQREILTSQAERLYRRLIALLHGRLQKAPVLSEEVFSNIEQLLSNLPQGDDFSAFTQALRQFGINLDEVVEEVVQGEFIPKIAETIRNQPGWERDINRQIAILRREQPLLGEEMLREEAIRSLAQEEYVQLTGAGGPYSKDKERRVSELRAQAARAAFSALGEIAERRNLTTFLEELAEEIRGVEGRVQSFGKQLENLRGQLDALTEQAASLQEGSGERTRLDLEAARLEAIIAQVETQYREVLSRLNFLQLQRAFGFLLSQRLGERERERLFQTQTLTEEEAAAYQQRVQEIVARGQAREQVVRGILADIQRMYQPILERAEAEQRAGNIEVTQPYTQAYAYVTFANLFREIMGELQENMGRVNELLGADVLSLDRETAILRLIVAILRQIENRLAIQVAASEKTATTESEVLGSGEKVARHVMETVLTTTPFRRQYFHFLLSSLHANNPLRRFFESMTSPREFISEIGVRRLLGGFINDVISTVQSYGRLGVGTTIGEAIRDRFEVLFPFETLFGGRFGIYTMPGMGRVFARTFREDLGDLLRQYGVTLEGLLGPTDVMTRIAGFGQFDFRSFIENVTIPVWRLARGTGFLGRESDVATVLAGLTRFMYSPTMWNRVFRIMASVMSSVNLKRIIGTDELLQSFNIFADTLKSGAAGGISPEALSAFARYVLASGTFEVGPGMRGIYAVQTAMSISQQLQSVGRLIHPMTALVFQTLGREFTLEELIAFQQRIDREGIFATFEVGGRRVTYAEAMVQTLDTLVQNTDAQVLILSRMFNLSVDRSKEFLNLLRRYTTAPEEERYVIEQKLATMTTELQGSYGERFAKALAERQEALMNITDEVIIPIMNLLRGFPQVIAGIGDILALKPIAGIQNIFGGLGKMGWGGIAFFGTYLMSRIIGEGFGNLLGDLLGNFTRNFFQGLRGEGLGLGGIVGRGMRSILARLQVPFFQRGTQTVTEGAIAGALRSPWSLTAFTSTLFSPLGVIMMGAVAASIIYAYTRRVIDRVEEQFERTKGWKRELEILSRELEEATTPEAKKAIQEKMTETVAKIVTEREKLMAELQKPFRWWYNLFPSYRRAVQGTAFEILVSMGRYAEVLREQGLDEQQALRAAEEKATQEWKTRLEQKRAATRSEIESAELGIRIASELGLSEIVQEGYKELVRRKQEIAAVDFAFVLQQAGVPMGKAEEAAKRIAILSDAQIAALRKLAEDRLARWQLRIAAKQHITSITRGLNLPEEFIQNLIEQYYQYLLEILTLSTQAQSQPSSTKTPVPSPPPSTTPQPTTPPSPPPTPSQPTPSQEPQEGLLQRFINFIRGLWTNERPDVERYSTLSQYGTNIERVENQISVNINVSPDTITAKMIEEIIKGAQRVAIGMSTSGRGRALIGSFSPIG